YSARSHAPIEVFVLRVIAVLRQREAEENYRRFHVFLHRNHSAYRAAFARKGWPSPESILHRFRSRIGVLAVELAYVGFERRDEFCLHILVFMSDEIA